MTAGAAPTRPGVPLDQPLYGATLGQAYRRFWLKYATFRGRASRSEFWWWFLVYVGVGIVLSIINRAVAGPASPADAAAADINESVKTSIASGIWSLVNLVGGITITVRRLHDTNRRGWWWFVQLIPLIGSIAMVVLVALPSNPAGRRFDH